MYAHQVLEDLNYLALKETEEFCSIRIRHLIDYIKNSQKFNIGEVNDLIATFQQGNGKVPLDIEIEFLRPPYPCTWIDFTVANELIGDRFPGTAKYGLLIFMLDNDEGCIQAFQYVRGWEHWVPNFAMMRFNLGKEDGGLIVSQSRVFKIAEKYLPEIKRDLKQHQFITGVITYRFNKFLSCKNIGTMSHEPPAKLNKSRKKKGKCPIFTYKTLVIKPVGKKQQNQAAQGLWENRIHLCRGHFKEYTPNKPLFGKVTGRYWWQPSVRGRNRNGVVVKDYKVEVNS